MNQEAGKRWFSLFPKELKACIEPVVRPALKEKGLAGSRIITDWQKIVGEHLAGHCVPQKLSFPRGKQTAGTLTIAVENGFATELQHMQPIILERLAIYFGYKAIDHISISHTIAKKALKKPVKNISSAIIPVTQNVRLALDETQDPELKAALESYTQTLNKS